MSDRATPARARQACEPCRRKKTKCPGEKPTCSFCQRLGQTCSYERVDTATARVHKSRRSSSHDSTGSKDRLQRLENRVEEVFDILSNFANRTSAQQSPGPPQNTQAPARTTRRSTTPGHESPTTTTASQTPRFDSTRSPYPPHDVWMTLVNIYQKRFDCQPIAALSSRVLATPPDKWLNCLRLSFLALTVPLIDSHSFYSGCLSEAVAFYTTTARREIFTTVAEGRISAAILQATCLSALRDVVGSNPFGCWMTISIGVRLAHATNVMSNRQDPKIAIDREDRVRCCWSLFALDRTYGSTLTIPPALSAEDVLPELPDSVSSPNLPGTITMQPGSVKDIGVVANYLQLLSIWGDAMKYVRSVKDGELEDPWSTKSLYHEAMVRIFEFETRYAQVHRFQQAKLQDRNIETLERQRQYWAPWLAGQFLFHAIQGLVNHPFLHIASKSRRQTFQPPSFQQNSIDQAVLHSAWILKCIEVCTDAGFKMYDPFLAHLAAITATIYLFLLNAKDEDLASQARAGFESCYNFIQSMTDSWPHLRNTIDKLDILQHAAITNSSVPAARSAPKAQRSLLWELLDYSASTTPSQVPEFASDAVDLNVDTRFLSPLNPLSSGHTPLTTFQQNNSLQQQAFPNESVVEATWDPAMDSFGFNLFDNEQMADLTNLTFGRDIWSFGQL